MKTQQKIVKFSKGEINPELNERADLELLDASASYIKNYIPTIYGGIKTRFGTEKVLKFSSFTKEFKTFDFTFSGKIYGTNLIPTDTEIINAKIKIDVFDDIVIQYTFQDVVIDGVNYKKLQSILITGNTDYQEYLLGYTSDAEITDAKFTCSIYNRVLSITWTGDFYYKDKYEFTITKNNPITPTYKIYIDGTLKKTTEIKLGAETTFEFNVNNNTSFDITGNETRGASLKISCLKYDATANNIRLVPFIYSKNDYRLIALTTNNIYIIKNDEILKTINLTSELSFVNLEYVKFSQCENMIIFTETEKKPRILKRDDSDNWTFEFFNIVNIPYHCFNEEKTTHKTNSIKPSATSGSISITGSGFNSGYVGQIIDGNGGRVRITEYVSSSKVNGYCIIPFYTSDSITSWDYISGYEPSYSESRGWPNTCLFYQERLFFAGSKSRPLNIIGSRINCYNDFENSSNGSNDALDFDLSSSDNSEIVNLFGARGLEIFTGGCEFIVSEGSLTPSSFTVSQVSNIGSKKECEPVQIGSYIVYMEKKGRNVYSLLYNFEESGYKSLPLSLLNNNVIKDPVNLGACYNPNWTDGNFIFIINNDGTITLDNFLNEQNFNSFTRIVNDNIYFYDCMTIQDDTYFLVKVNDYVELLKLNNDVKTDFTDYRKNFNSNVIENVEEWNGLDVRVYYFEDGEVVNVGIFKPSGGKISLGKTIKTDKLYFGIDIECELKSNNIMVGNNSFNIKKRIATATITCNNKTEKLTFNKKSPLPTERENEKIYKVLNGSSFNIQTYFTLESIFDYLEIKSIVLNINYGK